MYQFKRGDILYNTLRTHPVVDYLIYDRKSYLNFKPEISGAYEPNVPGVATGHASLYELNVDRPSGSVVYPFITKGSSRITLQSVTTANFNSNFEFGDIVSGSYPLSATIGKIYRSADSARPYVDALVNVLNGNKIRSPHYAYSSSFGDKSVQKLGLVTIPSIFYGSTIKRGTVFLKFYVTGTLIGELADTGQNGVLYETTGSNVGESAGVVLYDEGFIVLTGSWDLSEGAHSEDYIGSSESPTWVYWGQSISGSIRAVSSSFQLQFQGTHDIPVLTMLSHAPRGELNYSSNPTFLSYSQTTTPNTSSVSWREKENLQIKNISKQSYTNTTSSFERITYISHINIYDKDRQVIGVAKLATPIRKREKDEYTFRLKLDM